jgi:hypothetical protein
MIWLAVLVPSLNLGNVFQIVLIVVMLLQIPEPEAGDVEPPKENAAGMWDLSLEYSCNCYIRPFLF